jgi:hypothetical protein
VARGAPAPARPTPAPEIGPTESAVPSGAGRATVSEAIGRHPLLTALPILLCLAAALAVGLNRAPTFTSTASMRVSALDLRAPGALGAVFTATESLARTYSLSVDSDTVLQRAAERLGMPIDSVRGAVSGTAIPESPVFTVSAVDGSAEGARQIANAVAASLTEVVGGQTSARETENLLRRYRRLSGLVSRAELAVAQARRDYDESASVRSARALGEARATLRAASLQRDSLKTAYLDARAGRNAAPRVQTMRRAQAGSSDRSSKLQIYLFAGLIGGLVLGAALATLRANGIRPSAASSAPVQ